MSRLAIALVLMLGLMGSAPSAAADTLAAGGDVQVAQSLGDRELTVVARRVTGIPGPLHVDVVTHAGTAPVTLRLQLIPTGSSTTEHRPAPGVATSEATVDIGEQPGPYGANLDVDRPGPADLTLSDGVYTARIPLVFVTQAASPAERMTYLGLAAAGVLMVVSLVCATRARRTAWMAIPLTATAVAVAVSITAAVLSGRTPTPPEPGLQRDPTVDNAANPYLLDRPAVTDFSRPSATLVVDKADIDAGRATDLQMSLVDGATGSPVDDLTIHDSALIHLLVVAPNGRLAHMHPIRVGPGRYLVRVSADSAGRYAVSGEFVRRGGGVQTVRLPGGIVARGGRPSPLPWDGPGMRMVDGVHVHVSATGLRAGQPTAVTATIGSQQVLQPWLGMLGHMVLAGPIPVDARSDDLGTAVQNVPMWAHAHSMGGHPVAADAMSGMPDMSPDTHQQDSAGRSMPAMVGAAPLNGDSPPDETVAAFGPDVPFVFTFPRPGRYLAWIQAQRDYRLLTIPLQLDIT